MGGAVRGYYSALSLSIFSKGNKRVIIYHSGHDRFRLCNGLIISQYLREFPGNSVQGFMLTVTGVVPSQCSIRSSTVRTSTGRTSCTAVSCHFPFASTPEKVR